MHAGCWYMYCHFLAFNFCGASKAERHLGITLSVVCLSVCLSVCHTFCLLITFLPLKVGHPYLACVFLMTTPFWWYHRFWARDLDCDQQSGAPLRDHFVRRLSVCPSVRPSVRLSVRLSHFLFAYNFFTFKGRASIFGMCVPYDNTFLMVP